MLNLLLYGTVLLFSFVYLLRALLMAGYERLNARNEKSEVQPLLQLLLVGMLTLKPLREVKLKARSIDQKKHLVFQKKASFYYYVLWVLLFIILFFVAKVYLNAF